MIQLFPRCPECRLGLGSHDERDPHCDHYQGATMSEAVNHPPHYGGADNPYEVIKVAEAWGLDKDAYLFNVLKYIGRADKKGATLQDHKKARFYLDRKIKNMEEAA